MDKIEIGIKIVPNIYLTVDEELPTVPFCVDNIVAVYCEGGKTIVRYLETENPLSSQMDSIPFEVLNSVEDVNNAIDEARFYKTFGLNAISEIAETKE
jgi:hypothetical protein